MVINYVYLRAFVLVPVGVSMSTLRIATSGRVTTDHWPSLLTDICVSVERGACGDLVFRLDDKSDSTTTKGLETSRH